MNRKLQVLTFGETAFRFGAKLKQNPFQPLDIKCFLHVKDTVPEGGIICETQGALCEQLSVVFKQTRRKQNLSLRGLWSRLVRGKNLSTPLVLVAGLGGGFASLAVVQAIRLAKEWGYDRVVAVVQLPFKFEGVKRRMLAEKSLEELNKYNIPIKIIDHARISEQCQEGTISDYFDWVDEQMMRFVKEIINSEKK